MPQLDSIGYLLQIFVTIRVITSLLIITLNNVVPLVSRILWVRTMKLTKAQIYIAKSPTTTKLNPTLQEKPYLL